MADERILHKGNCRRQRRSAHAIGAGAIPSGRGFEYLSIWQQRVVGVSWPRKVAVTERDHFRKSPIAIHSPENFMGELAQLIDRPGRLVVEGGCPRLRI